MAAKARARCSCGTFVVKGCKKCGRQASHSNDETAIRLRRWCERQRALGLVNPFEWAVLDRMMDDVFGERL